MSYLNLDPSADRLIHSARLRDRDLPPLPVLIDAPRTASALQRASTRWAELAASHAEAATGWWEDAARFLSTVTVADQDLAGRFRP